MSFGIVRGLLLLITLFFLAPLPVRAITPADEPLVKVVEKVRPSVVNINTEKVVQQVVTDPFNVFFNNYRVQNAKQTSLGTGVLIHADGYIVTCAHVVGRAADQTTIQVTLADGSDFPAKLLYADEEADLALLKIERKEKFPALSLAIEDLSPNLLGETVAALGNPQGYQNSVSAGILSARDRKVKTNEGTTTGLLQTNAAINPGNSGGALVDIEGKLVGICNAKLAGQAVEGIGFAIPAAKVSAWVADAIAIAKGDKKPPTPASIPDLLDEKFGLRLQNITPDLAQAFGLPSTSGLIISGVAKGSPAEAAKMREGMVIVGIGNVPILNEDSLPHQLRRVQKGDPVSFTVAVFQQQGAFSVRRSQAVTLQAR
ncbi:trypsin-like peptidase domain-containing protein [Verrucomicrobium sp. GAS474]|uniref:S1C family serine protease n=1 Tax=Verrucomicrobium sp. GAS474 TaxID=1882831 RepID=UPI001390614A|nr:trypsin-like peptidase domain-containing protein [Verrucomicrobium sp. GAS474]